MQTDLLLCDIDPPSYEESVYFTQNDQQKCQHPKLLPPCYNRKVTTCSFDSESPMDERLERVSSCLQQMIEVAQASLERSPDESCDCMASVDEPAKVNTSVRLQKQSKRYQRVSRKKSLERLRSSQSSLARTINQLNLSITQHVISESISPITFDQHNDDTSSHFHYRLKGTSFFRQQKLRSTQKRTIYLWVVLSAQMVLVFSIAHYVLSWSKTTSSVASITWLIATLLAKKGKASFSRSASSFSVSSSFYLFSKSPFWIRISSTMTAIFGQQ